MATLTISLDSPAQSRTRTLSSGDLTKLQTAFTEILQAQGIPSPTVSQIFDYWVSRWVADTITIVRQQQQADANAAVVSITLS